MHGWGKNWPYNTQGHRLGQIRMVGRGTKLIYIIGKNCLYFMGSLNEKIWPSKWLKELKMINFECIRCFIYQRLKNEKYGPQSG